MVVVPQSGSGYNLMQYINLFYSGEAGKLEKNSIRGGGMNKARRADTKAEIEISIMTDTNAVSGG